MEDMFVVVLPKRLWRETKFELGKIDNGSWMINICNNCMQIFSTTNVCMDNEQQAHELKSLPNFYVVLLTTIIHNHGNHEFLMIKSQEISRINSFLWHFEVATNQGTTLFFTPYMFLETWIITSCFTFLCRLHEYAWFGQACNNLKVKAS